jgi:hypothetical protein
MTETKEPRTVDRRHLNSDTHMCKSEIPGRLELTLVRVPLS